MSHAFNGSDPFQDHHLHASRGNDKSSFHRPYGLPHRPAPAPRWTMTDYHLKGERPASIYEARIPTISPQSEQGDVSYEGLDQYKLSHLNDPGLAPSKDSVSHLNRSRSGRLSLPGPTAQAQTPNLYLPTIPSQQRRLGIASSKELGQTKPQYPRTPSVQYIKSSSSAVSPTLLIGQRREASGQTRGTVPPPNVGKRRSSHGDHHSYSMRSPRLARGTQIPQEITERRLQGDGPPSAQGITLVSPHELPDRFRSIFGFPLFNAIQSRCYASVYGTGDNLVVSAPTGGGKTVILELAICRLLAESSNPDQFKIVYMAPTKSLCSERYRDWQGKFSTLDLQCAELTGDTTHVDLRNVQGAHIIITTPEKWDSMTRKWKDHAKLMQMVKLVLIDEVHILKDVRGATLEAVVSRMQSIGANVRFIALSATIPNSNDIADWLGKDSSHPGLPAAREVFGEEFRPVKLQKHVVGLAYTGNDFGFERVCNPALPDIIKQYSQHTMKPIMVFCITRKSTVDTAKILAASWTAQSVSDRSWMNSQRHIRVIDVELQDTLKSGVAFHHAGLDLPDRSAVEQGFLEGNVNVICCTSTLAMGVNLPCHMVIIKNTVSYQDDGLHEYSDLEIMQMLGRAGRPQFDDSAISVIITKKEKTEKYQKLIAGSDVLESSLHLNLIEHLNAEISLGTICDIRTAKKWLRGTFLHVRLGRNPMHYRLEGDSPQKSLDDRMEAICGRALALLQDFDLVVASHNGQIRSTAFGEIMARYYVQFETMKTFLGLESQPKVSDILSAIVQAHEYHDIRLRIAEKKLFKEINRQNGIKYPIKVDLALNAHKRSLIVQSELGCVDFPSDDEFAKLKMQFGQDKHRIFRNIHRLAKCMIDCFIELQDAAGVRNALELACSLSVKVWANSPYQLKQLPQIGVVAIRKLVFGGITSLEDLEISEPHRIEMLLSKNPPFGSKLLQTVNSVPKLRVSLKLMGRKVTKDKPVIVNIKADWGFINDPLPSYFQRKPINVCLVAERSDGYLIDFRRISGTKLGLGVDALMSVELFNAQQTIKCYVMCDEIAGTLREAELSPNIPSHLFANTGKAEPTFAARQTRRPAPVSESQWTRQGAGCHEADEFDDKDLDESVFQAVADAAVDDGFQDVESYQNQKFRSGAGPSKAAWEPQKMPNGKWACNHRCNNKSICKHICCREGVDKKPKPPKHGFVNASSLVESAEISREKSKPTDESKAKRSMPSALPVLTKETKPKGPRQSLITPMREPLRQQSKLWNMDDETDSVPSELANKQSVVLQSGLRRDTESQPKFDMQVTSLKPSTISSDERADGLPPIEGILTREEKYEASHESAHLPPIELGETLHNKTQPHRTEASLSGSEDIKAGDLSDIEEALIGFDDSTSIGNPTLPVPPKIETQSDKLFLSTDSPEKDIIHKPKRKPSSDIYQSPRNDSQAGKKRRLEEDVRADSKTQLASGDQDRRAGNGIKEGLPSWVYEFDPAFVEQYQDYVEFV